MKLDKRILEIRRESSSDEVGDPERFRRVELTKIEMMSQGLAVRSTLEANKAPLMKIAQDLKQRQINRIVMVGCGDSWISGYGVRHVAEKYLKAVCEPYEAFDFSKYGLDVINSETLVIGLSSSGKTEPVIHGLKESAKRGAYTIGCSNTENSPLMQEFPGALHIKATRDGWPTQSSTAAMALKIALIASVAEAKGIDVDNLNKAILVLPSQIDEVAQSFFVAAKTLGKKLARAELILLTGAGPHYAPASFGAAKLKELAPIHAYAFPLEEYHHYRTQKEGDPMFIMAPDTESHGRAYETAIMSQACKGFCIVLVPKGENQIAKIADVVWEMPKVEMETAPIIYSIPLHLFGYHVAVERDSLGLGAPMLGGRIDT